MVNRWEIKFFCFFGFCFLRICFDNDGVNVKVIKVENIIDIVRVRVNLLNICFVFLLENFIGRNIVIKIMVVVMIVNIIFFIFNIVVFIGVFFFCWIYWIIFFKIIIVLLIIKFVESVRVNRVRVLMENFIKNIILKVLIREMGIVIVGIIVVC